MAFKETGSLMENAIRAREWLVSNRSSRIKADDFKFSDLTDLETKHNNKAISISITAGKGGVGKTSFAVKIAKELALKNNRVLLIDCDYNLSNTAIKMGVPVTDNFLSLLSAKKSFEECLYKEGTFHLLSGCNGSLEIFEEKIELENIIIDIIASHEGEYDYIILDCPAGLQKETLILNAYCDHRFFIVTPDKSSITDSYSQIKILKHKFGIMENHLIVNRFDNKEQYARVVRTLSETIENFLGCRTYILGGIPKYDCLADKFDTLFLKNRKSIIHERFIKVLEKFTETWGVSAGCNLKKFGSQHSRDGFEQDVQQF